MKLVAKGIDVGDGAILHQKVHIQVAQNGHNSFRTWTQISLKFKENGVFFT